MTDSRFNLIVEPQIRVTLTGGAHAKMTLPQVCAALVADRIETFPALRPHQAPAWHAFLVQISAMGLEALGTTELPGEDEWDWARLLRSLTPDWPDDEPWCLVSPATSPALLQAPVPEADADCYDKIFSKTVIAADALDMLVTSKNHDLKSARMHAAEPDDWLFSLVSLQTQGRYSGRGNYGIARMNSGSGNRSYVALRPSASTPGAAFRHDLQALSVGVNALWKDAEPIRLGRHEALALLWTVSWNGEDSLPLSRLHPLFVELCRRVRLELRNGTLSARVANSTATRVEAKERKGNLADPWTPVERSDEPKALSLTAEGFSYRQMNELLFGSDKRFWQLPRLAKVCGSPPAAQFVAEGIACGKQGKTAGFHRRSVPVPDAAVRLLDTNRDMVSGRARERVRTAAAVQNKCLRRALVTLVQKGPVKAKTDKQKPSNKTFTLPWIQRFDRAVDRIFFTELWGSLECDDEAAALSWALALAGLARDTLDAASEAAPRGDERRIMARARARNMLEDAMRKQLPDMSPPSQGAPAHDRS